MSAADTRAVIERFANTRRELGAEDFAAYAFLAMGLLADQAPEVLSFILDRTDSLLAPAGATS